MRVINGNSEVICRMSVTTGYWKFPKVMERVELHGPLEAVSDLNRTLGAAKAERRFPAALPPSMIETVEATHTGAGIDCASLTKMGGGDGRFDFGSRADARVSLTLANK